MGESDKVEDYCRRAMVIREEKLGTEHPETASAYHHLACIYYKRGNVDKALPLFSKAYAIRRDKLGSDHHATQDTLGCLIQIGGNPVGI